MIRSSAKRPVRARRADKRITASARFRLRVTAIASDDVAFDLAEPKLSLIEP
jgi:hypothetical protein